MAGKPEEPRKPTPKDDTPGRPEAIRSIAARPADPGPFGGRIGEELRQFAIDGGPRAMRRNRLRALAVIILALVAAVEVRNYLRWVAYGKLERVDSDRAAVGSLLSARRRIDWADPSIGPGGFPKLTHGAGAPISRVGSARS
jgi:hypothetical protein